MDYTMTKPCSQCPFLKSMARGFTMRRLKQFAASEFPCHKTAEYPDDDSDDRGYQAVSDSQHCAGALIFNEKRGTPSQMMRICERLGRYDRTKLDMASDVR